MEIKPSTWTQASLFLPLPDTCFEAEAVYSLPHPVWTQVGLTTERLTQRRLYSIADKLISKENLSGAGHLGSAELSGNCPLSSQVDNYTSKSFKETA